MGDHDPALVMSSFSRAVDPRFHASTRMVIGILVALLLLAPLQAQFDIANQLYDQEKFSEAKQEYEKLVSGGERNANLFYNLGNAFFRLGAPGLAALNYERALALDPDHPEAALNLRLLRDQTGARVFPATWRDHLFVPVRTDLFSMIAAVAGWASMFCLVGMMMHRARISAVRWLTLMVLLAIAGYAVAGLWLREKERRVAVVTARQTEARLAPADRATRAETLSAGSRVRIISERGDWSYCALPGGGLGWLPTRAIEQVALSPS